jgi:regulatory protein
VTPSLKQILDNVDNRVLYRKAADYCAIQDRCISEIRSKLIYWGADSGLTDLLIQALVNEGFIDEQRFANAFARGKFRNLQWGKVKIRYELKNKGITQAMIEKALSEIDEEDYLSCLNELISKKQKSGSGKDPLKIMRFLASKGFETDLIRKVMKTI